MILKEEGVYDIDKLRTIVLFEADFNMNNKHYSRKMMHHCVDTKQLAHEQYSIPGKKSIDHALNKRSIFDINRYKKNTLAMASCNLKSCFDRVAHTPAVLAMASKGIPVQPMHSMFETLQNTQFITRTAFGDSEESFGGQEDGFIAAPQTLGQGNGTGPQIWAIVSSKMFEVLQNEGLATKIITPITKEALEPLGFAYVDNADIIAMADGHEADETFKKMQETLNYWEGVAKTTGGALAPNKCWWYLVEIRWKKDGTWEYYQGEREGVMKVQDKDNNWGTLKHLQVTEAKKMLGVYLAPNGDDSHQKKVMVQKAVKFGERIRTGAIQKRNVWLAFTMMAMKSIEYPLQVLSLSEKDYKDIMWPILKDVLPKAGFNRHFPHAVVYGPASFQGLGVHNPYIMQGVTKVATVIEQMWKGTMTGTFIQTALEYLRLEIGLNIDIFKSNFNDYGHLVMTESWISDMWKFMSIYGLKWEDNTSKVFGCREGDIPIMQAIQNAKVPVGEQLQCNRCRLFIRAFTLADITTGDGKSITTAAWTLQQQNVRGLNWPLWGRPNNSDIMIWRRVIRQVFCPARHLELERPLGLWFDNVYWNWEWYCTLC